MGSLVFGLILIVFLSISDSFAEKAVQRTMNSIGRGMANSLFINSAGSIELDDSQDVFKWGFDAFYSNVAYRLLDSSDQTVVLRSAPKGTEGFLFDNIPLNIPLNYSNVDTNNTLLYRMEVTLDKKNYYFDFARSDRAQELVNEAVAPAMMKVGVTIIIIAFLLFLIVSVIAIKLIVKPANLLTRKIEGIKPEDLKKRIEVSDVPKELLPIANAMNDALGRVEESFEQRKRFIADAAHELRTPLTILLNRLELKLPASSSKSELVNDARFISRIVEQLLDLSRAQNMSMNKLSEIKLVDVVKNVCLHLAPLAVSKSQDFELVDNKETDTIHIDEGELTVIVKNLLENAIKHSPDGARIRVTISGNGFIVEDSGNGIHEQYHEQVFERFWRKNQSDRSGSGLGLAITRELLSHYDASIVISKSSSLGGAMFCVHFKKNSSTNL